MHPIAADSTITLKTRDLCQAIVEHPWFQTLQARIDSFMTNDVAKEQYQRLNEKGQFLQHKQEQGAPLMAQEIAEFELLREAFFANPVAREFFEAQEEIQKVQESVGRCVSMTFELGRLPNPEEMSGSCGSGCGCSH
ncbi:MAG: YlbF family regulator [Planctomycetes bacterium]|nr:YlbF family regulator [Planctomycetota bacterium]